MACCDLVIFINQDESQGIQWIITILFQTSSSITYILSINQPRVELRSHLAAALHAVPPGVAHQSQNNIRVVMSHLDQQPSPRRHHQELTQYLRYHIREHRAFVGHAAFTIEDAYTLLATACQCYIEQLPPRPSTRAARHRDQEASASSSSTSSSNIEHREPQLHIGMICIKDHSGKIIRPLHRRIFRLHLDPRSSTTSQVRS